MSQFALLHDVVSPPVVLYATLLLCLESRLYCTATMKQSRFYGLRGTSLNVAIAVIAGTDFALFGYDQVRHQLLDNPSRCFDFVLTFFCPGGHGRSLDAAFILTILSSSRLE